jgi:hypothetical protein
MGALNNPFVYVDPTGEDVVLTGSEEDQQRGLNRLRRVLGDERFALLDLNFGLRIDTSITDLRSSVIKR